MAEREALRQETGREEASARVTGGEGTQREAEEEDVDPEDEVGQEFDPAEDYPILRGNVDQ